MSMMTGIPAPHPSTKETFSLAVVGGTAGNIQLTMKKPGSTVVTANIAWTAAAATVAAALGAGVTCTGGALNTAPVVIEVDQSVGPVDITISTNTVVTGTATITKTASMPTRLGRNVTIEDTAQPAGARARNGTDPQYGQTPYTADPAAITTAVGNAATANALTDPKSHIHGHTGNVGPKPKGAN